MKRVLVTGAYGFNGSHFVEHCLQTTDWEIVNLYSLRHKGCSLRHVESDRVTNIFHDLNGPINERLESLIGSINYIVHMAAESHVERSIDDPVPFVQNNVNVSLNLLEFARRYMAHSKMGIEDVPLEAFVQISTDEVYGPAIQGDLHEEWREIVPSNPYAASKAAQEALSISYWRTYGLPLIITNTMNLIGPRQDAEKFVPSCIAKIQKGETITIHGTLNNIGSRQYLHSKGHADAILFLLKSTVPTEYYPEIDNHYQRPDRYNIVGDLEINNLDLAVKIGEIMGLAPNVEFLDFHAARPGHDKRYALNGKKIKDLGWTNPFPLDDTLRETIEYALKHPEWLL